MFENLTISWADFNEHIELRTFPQIYDYTDIQLGSTKGIFQKSMAETHSSTVNNTCL